MEMTNSTNQIKNSTQNLTTTTTQHTNHGNKFQLFFFRFIALIKRENTKQKVKI